MPMPVETRRNRIRRLLRWARQQMKKHNDVAFRDMTPLYRTALILFPLISEDTAKSYARAALRILQEEQREKKKGDKPL